MVSCIFPIIQEPKIVAGKPPINAASSIPLILQRLYSAAPLAGLWAVSTIFLHVITCNLMFDLTRSGGALGTYLFSFSSVSCLLSLCPLYLPLWGF